MLAFLFGTFSMMVSAVAAAGEPVPPAASQQGPRQHLVGVVLSTAQVLLWDEDAGAYVLHRVGDELPAGKIVGLEEDHLVLDRGDSIEEMGISPPPQRRVASRHQRRRPAAIVSAVPDSQNTPNAEDSSPAGPAPALMPTPAAPPAPPAAPAPPPVRATPPSPPPAAAYEAPPPGAPPAAPMVPAGVALPEAQVMPVTVIPRSHIERELNDPAALLQQVAVAPMQQGGYRLVMLQPGSFLERAGLRLGDTVLRIDRRPIGGAEDALAAAKWLQLTDHFSVDVVRGGRLITLRYAVQPS